MASFTPEAFKVDISENELNLLRQKLQLARLPVDDGSTWGEDDGITISFMRETVKHWLDHYDWYSEQNKINELPQFKVSIELEHWGLFSIHFVHARCGGEGEGEGEGKPLLFLHGWPGNFTEVTRILAPLLSAGYNVVAPSLPGFGFSSYPTKNGFKNWHSAELMHKLMTGLGYDRYIVAGGDWGAMIGTSCAQLYTQAVVALHLTNVFVQPPPDHDRILYTPFEQSSLDRMKWFFDSQSGYGQIQKTKPRTLGFAMHDSPVGMLAWMADKLLLWSDEYPWTKDEIITWTLMHYLPGPSTAFQMYRENLPVFESGEIPPSVESPYVNVPTGVSAFAKEVFMVPREWAEKSFNLVEWREQPKGGHFPAYEQPHALAESIVSLAKAQWMD